MHAFTVLVAALFATAQASPSRYTVSQEVGTFDEFADPQCNRWIHDTVITEDRTRGPLTPQTRAIKVNYLRERWQLRAHGFRTPIVHVNNQDEGRCVLVDAVPEGGLWEALHAEPRQGYYY